MSDKSGNEDDPRRTDWITSTILIVIWILGLIFATQARPGIPRSMLIIGTIFFVVLIPAMTELVRSIERLIDKEVSVDPRSRDESRNRNRPS